MSVIFQTDRLTIRPYTEADFEHFFILNSDEEIVRYIRPAQTREQALEFFHKVISDYEALPGLGRWAAYSRDDGRFIGSFAVIPVKDSEDIQLGYAFLKENWGYGYASEVVRGGITYAASNLKFESIAGITESENTASQKVLLKNGFVFEKTFKEEEKELFLYRLFFTTPRPPTGG